MEKRFKFQLRGETPELIHNTRQLHFGKLLIQVQYKRGRYDLHTVQTLVSPLPANFKSEGVINFEKHLS